MKDDLQSYKCLVNVFFINLKDPLSKTFKILKVLFRTVTISSNTHGPQKYLCVKTVHGIKVIINSRALEEIAIYTILYIKKQFVFFNCWIQDIYDRQV